MFKHIENSKLFPERLFAGIIAYRPMAAEIKMVPPAMISSGISSELDSYNMPC